MPKLIVIQDQTHTELSFEGTPVLGALLAQHGFGVQQPCGGRGVCGKCAVQVVGNVSAQTEAEIRAGSRLACQTTLLGDCEVLLPAKREGISIQTEGSSQALPAVDRLPMTGDYGAAVDIGTTTVALKLVELHTGKCLSAQAALNPQTQVAADVIGRISAAMNGSSVLLKDAITDCVRTLLVQACEEAKIAEAKVSSLVLTGNTTMLYLLTGRNPQPLSHAPFRADTLFGGMEELLRKSAYLPPCMDAFVGADITCAVLASGLCDRHETALLMDVGTNGEVALWHEGKLYVASTAAGPAFEGVGISCGCGSVSGAVDKVWVENGKLGVHTIDCAPPVGICGSGLIDAIAAMLELGWIDETGAMDEEEAAVAGPVSITARDVRNVQLAKGAIAAGVQTMLRAAGITTRDVKTLFIAGGFGSHLDVGHASQIGLIPREWTQRVRVIGNAALSGAQGLMLNRALVSRAQEIAHQAQTVMLGGNPVFSELYMECMMFEA